MLTIISPSKTMLSEKLAVEPLTVPEFSNEYRELVRSIKKLPFEEVKKLMNTSDKLTGEVLNMFKNIPKDIEQSTGNPAILSFKGDVYLGLSTEKFTEEDRNFAQIHLRILSGLYGVLKPMDSIYPYRLEMGSSFKTKKANNLYNFWGKKIAKSLALSLESHEVKVLINLASGEYFKSVSIKDFPYPIYHIDFKENKNGVLTGNSFTNKKMRGVMAGFIVRNKIQRPDELIFFKEEGFRYSSEHSKDYLYVFVR